MQLWQHNTCHLGSSTIQHMDSILLGTQFHHIACWQPSWQERSSWQQMDSQQLWQHSTCHLGSSTIQHMGSILLGTQFHHIACWQPSWQEQSSWQQMDSQQLWLLLADQPPPLHLQLVHLELLKVSQVGADGGLLDALAPSGSLKLLCHLTLFPRLLDDGRLSRVVELDLQLGQVGVLDAGCRPGNSRSLDQRAVLVNHIDDGGYLALVGAGRDYGHTPHFHELFINHLVERP